MIWIGARPGAFGHGAVKATPGSRPSNTQSPLTLSDRSTEAAQRTSFEKPPDLMRRLASENQARIRRSGLFSVAVCKTQRDAGSKTFFNDLI